MPVDFRFDEAKHEYFADGVRVPGVTSILDDLGLIPDYKIGPYRVRGKRVHQACALIDQGEDLDDYDVGADLVEYIRRYRCLIKEIQPEWTMIEQPLFSSFYCYAGTVDRVGTMFGKTVVVDIKTGKTGPETGLQTAAYAILAKGNLEFSATRYKFDLSEGDGKLVRYEDPHDFEAWTGALSFWRWLQKNKTRRN